MNLKNKSILYLEDDVLIAQSLIRLLSLFFKKVVHCTNGCEGIEKYHKNKFDIILSDINMPLMNGIEFVENIRNIDKNIPIFLYSSFQKKDVDLEKINITAYFEKPLSSKKFMDFIQQCENRLILKK